MGLKVWRSCLQWVFNILKLIVGLGSSPPIGFSLKWLTARPVV